MTAPQNRTSKKLFWHLVALYSQGSVAAVGIVLFLVWIGLEFSGRQWLVLFALLPFAVSVYVIPDIYLIARHYRPIGKVLGGLDRGETPASGDVSKAIVRALNLPYYAFLRVVLFHGPAAAMSTLATLTLANKFLLQGEFDSWQRNIFATIVFFFASPTHAIFEFFAVSKSMAGVIERLYPLVGTLERDDLAELRSVGLRKKLLYLAIFVTSLPLLFLAGSAIFKVTMMLNRMGTAPSPGQMTGLLVWIFGVVAVCMLGALMMAVLTASEVSSSAAKLIEAMRLVERGDLNVHLHITSTDEYADLYRGFNLMTEGLREEVKILGISHDLMGELHLDVLLERIMRATTELLSADRSTLFLYDKKTDELWSRFAEGLDSRDIRIPASQGIAGSVFRSRKSENITDAHADPRFNSEIDRRTGYHTQTILTVPVINKSGQCIGVTQVLNKEGGPFTYKDEARLRAFTAQISIALENAKLFDDVLRVQNYNASILRSTSNAMITLDADRKVVTANAATEKLLKVDEDVVVGRCAEDLFAPPNDWVLRSLGQVETTGESEIAVDAELKLHTGDVASVNLTSVPLIDAAQARIGSMLILEDITDEKRVKSTMSRYMSKEVVDQLLRSGEAALGGQLQQVSVLFSDIRDFTTVSESLGPRETVSMLNEYFGEMVDAIFRHQGILDKYIGDAIMALFGAPFPGEQDADNAASTAIDMIVTLRELNRRRVADGKAAINIGIGVNTGDVVLGSIGSPKRMEYTAIGDGVNLASRLESVCKQYGAKIILSEYTVRALKKPIRTRQIDLLRVKGKNQPVAIYEALDHHTRDTFPELDNVLECYLQGLEAYRQRNWTGAIGCFERGLGLHQGDKTCDLYIGRCREFMAEPPPDDWDGVWVMKTK